MNSRLNILLSAHFCSPYRGGEAAVGWNVAIGLAKRHNVTLMCGDLGSRTPNKDDIERFRLEHGLPEGINICHIQGSFVARIFQSMHKIPGMWNLYYVAYRVWQMQAYKTAKVLHSRVNFDLVHHLNVIGYREPGYLWRLGIPFYWGPMTGAPQVPASYLREFGFRERVRWSMRNYLNQVQMRTAPRVRKAAAAATKIWTVSKEDTEMVEGLWGARAFAMIETGCLLDGSSKPRRRELGQPLRLVWSGLFQGIKALPLLLSALARITDQNWSLDVLGAGPEETKWHEMTHQLGLDRNVRYHGFIPRVGALEVMKRSDLLIHTSVKEGTPHVVLEALSMGLPVVCHDSCGMSYAVTEDCGIKVALLDPEASIIGFKAAIELIQKNPSIYNSLSEGALNRANELTWEKKVEAFCVAYSQNKSI